MADESNDDFVNNASDPDNPDEGITNGPDEWPKQTQQMVADADVAQQAQAAGDEKKSEEYQQKVSETQQMLDAAMNLWNRIFGTGGMVETLRKEVLTDHASSYLRTVDDQYLFYLIHQTRLRRDDLPSKAAMLKALYQELNRRHPKPNQQNQQHERVRPGAEQERQASAPSQDTQAASTAADGQMLNFYIQTRRYAKELAWNDLWSQYFQHVEQVADPNAGLVELLQFKSYSNELLSRYFKPKT